MADERIQELLRELRERWGVKVVPEPPPEVLAWLRKAERYISSSPPPFELKPWLSSLPSEADHELCLARGPSGAICDLQSQHDSQHSCRTGLGMGTVRWPASTRSPPQFGYCDASYDSGRLRCVLARDHQHSKGHEYEEVSAFRPYDWGVL